MMPESMTEKQTQAFLSLKNTLHDYQDLRIDYDIIYDQGFFDAKTLQGQGLEATKVLGREDVSIV